jgi:putative RecB family exonuclease
VNIEKISASAIKTFEKCQLEFYAIYVLKVPPVPPHPKTVMGSAVHAMMEEASNLMIAARKQNDPLIVDPMQFKQKACDKLKVERNLFSTIDELVDNAKRWGYFRNIHKTAGCELEIGFSLPDGTWVKGFIDRLDLDLPSADIIDLKTQKNAFTTEELEDNWQARIYNIGARRLYPELTGNATVSFWVLRHMVQRITMTQLDAERDYQLLKDKVAEIKACTDPQPSPSRLCEWCPYVKTCPTSSENSHERLKRIMRR